MPTIVRGDVQAGYRGIPYRGVGVVAYAAPTGDFPCRSGVSRDGDGRRAGRDLRRSYRGCRWLDADICPVRIYKLKNVYPEELHESR